MKPVNIYAYPNSPLSGSSVEADARENPDRLFNAKDPLVAVLHEKPEHRMVLMLKAQGKSNREIYRALGGTYDFTGKPKNDGVYTEIWIGQILRQPWAREWIVREIRASGADGLQALLAANAEDAVYKLIELQNTAKEESVQRGCANDLLDRFLGKPVAHVKTEADVRHTINDIETLDRDLAETQSELARLMGGETLTVSHN